MAEGYLKAFGSSLIASAAWVFTVGGAIASLVVGGEYRWIAVLVYITGFVALFLHGRQTYQAGWTEREELAEKLRAEVQRREEAERRLAELPAEALARLATLVAEGTVNELVILLARQAGMIGRLKLFTAAQTKPLLVRSFHRQQGELYVVVKGLEQALPYLQPGDPFVLLRRNDAGVEISVARLVVHQPISVAGELVYFRIAAPLSDAVAHLTGLAGEQPIEGLKGYVIAPGLDLDGVPELDFAQVAQAIPHLAANLSRPQGR